MNTIASSRSVTWILPCLAGLLGACSLQRYPAGDAPPDPSTQVTLPADQMGGEIHVVGPGDIVAGAIVTNVLPLCPPGDATQPYRTGHSLAVDPAAPNLVYVGVEGRGLFRSRDGGATWKRSIAGMKAHYVEATSQLCFDEFATTAIDPRDSKHVCVGVRGGAGTTRDPLLAANGVYCSHDGGSRWVHRTPDTVNTAVNALAIDPDTTNQIYAGVSGAAPHSGAHVQHRGVINTSYDDGRSWTELAFAWGFSPGMEVSDLLVAQSWPRRLYAGAPVITSVTPAHAYEGAQFGLLTSTDGGLTWDALDHGMGDANSARAITRVAASSFKPERLLVATGNIPPAAGPYFYWTADGGSTFHQPTTPSDLALDIFAFDPSDTSGRHALGLSTWGDKLWETQDGGQTWQDRGPTLPEDAHDRPVRLTSLVWSTDPSVLYLAGSHASVYRSGDFGATWKKVLT